MQSGNLIIQQLKEADGLLVTFCEILKRLDLLENIR